MIFPEIASGLLKSCTESPPTGLHAKPDVKSCFTKQALRELQFPPVAAPGVAGMQNPYFTWTAYRVFLSDSIALGKVASDMSKNTPVDPSEPVGPFM